jgi:hypothetical protein
MVSVLGSRDCMLTRCHDERQRATGKATQKYGRKRQRKRKRKRKREQNRKR